MNKVIAIIALTCLGITLGILIPIYGWGLEPKSWWWIIGGGFGMRLIIETLYEVSKRS